MQPQFSAFSHPVQERHRWLGRRVGLQRGRLIVALALAGILGIIAALAALFHAFYEYGLAHDMFLHAVKKHGPEPFRRLQSWLTTGSAGQDWATFATGFGAVAVLVLYFLHFYFPMLPLHPIGYAIANSFSMKILWLPVFLAWLVKALVLRYGSSSAVRRIFPLALGLVLGNFVIGGAWILLGLALNIRTYSFWQ